MLRYCFLWFVCSKVSMYLNILTNDHNCSGSSCHCIMNLRSRKNVWIASFLRQTVVQAGHKYYVGLSASKQGLLNTTLWFLPFHNTPVTKCAGQSNGWANKALVVCDSTQLVVDWRALAQLGKLSKNVCANLLTIQTNTELDAQTHKYAYIPRPRMHVRTSA